MTTGVARLLSKAEAAIGEAPLWLENQLLWTDPVGKRLLRFANGALTAQPVKRAIWSLGLLPDGTVAGTLDGAFCVLGQAADVSSGPAAPLESGTRLNDMAVDIHGGLWAGVMHRGLLATRGTVIYAREIGEMPRLVAAGLGVPNGMCFSDDGMQLYLVDTLARILLAYPVREDGLGEPSVVGDFLDLRGKPDGMTLAPDGTLWVAMWGGGCVVQLAPDGAILREVTIPAPHVSSLCFVGDGRLLVTTSRMRLSPQLLAEYPASGGLFEIAL